MECVAAVGWDFNVAFPDNSVAGKTFRVGGKTGGFTAEDGCECGEVREQSPDAGVEFPAEARNATPGFCDGFGLAPCGIGSSQCSTATMPWAA